jgi:hypothetical protein
MMKTISLKLLTTLALLLALVVTLVPGCRGGGAASMPIEVKLSFSEPPMLGKPVQVTATFSLVRDYFRETVNDVDARIIFSEGFELVDGTLGWKGDFVRGQTYTISARIKSIKMGTWEIGAKAWSNSAGAVGYKTWYVTVTEKRATVDDRPPPGTITPPRPTSPPSDYPVPSTPIPGMPLPNPKDSTITPKQTAKGYFAPFHSLFHQSGEGN